MVTTIQFYHLTTTPLERALPKLLEKAFSAGFKAQVLAESEERVDQLNQLLWTYDPNSFLPHGSAKEGDIEHQPILLTTTISDEHPANVLVITNSVLIEPQNRFERVLDMFDGCNPEAVEKARQRWSTYKNTGYSLSYMQQNAAGGWEQKAA